MNEEQAYDLEKDIEHIVECEKEYMNFQSKHQLIAYIARRFYNLGKQHGIEEVIHDRPKDPRE